MDFTTRIYRKLFWTELDVLNWLEIKRREIEGEREILIKLIDSHGDVTKDEEYMTSLSETKKTLDNNISHMEQMVNNQKEKIRNIRLSEGKIELVNFKATVENIKKSIDEEVIEINRILG
jgi:hypothetical protein